MANAKTRERLSRTLNNDAAAPKGPAIVDAQSAQREEQILALQPIKTSVGGSDVELHPLPARQQRRFAGLFAQIMADVTGKPMSGGGSAAFRISGVLAESDEFSEKFAWFVARAMFPTDTPLESLGNLPNVQAKIEEQATYTELAALFGRMVELNGTAEVFGRPN